METNCEHELSRGIWDFSPIKYYSYCIKCKKKWFDDGQRWENDSVARAKVKEWEEQKAETAQ